MFRPCLPFRSPPQGLGRYEPVVRTFSSRPRQRAGPRVMCRNAPARHDVPLSGDIRGIERSAAGRQKIENGSIVMISGVTVAASPNPV